MSESGVILEEQNAHLQKDVSDPSSDVVQQNGAHATDQPKNTEQNNEVPPKKRKTRRGKSKRKHPYIKSARKSNKVIKPEAPHNSNQFLLEDHGIIEELDEDLKCADQVSTSTVTRTRDSSFSADSDGDFYISPDDGELFLIKDFVDQYESVQAERLMALSKTQLIEEYRQLENKLEILSKRVNDAQNEDGTTGGGSFKDKLDLQREIERLKIENEQLRRENELLKSKVVICSDTEDSETDSSDSCSSSSNSSSSASSVSGPASPRVDYSQTNGHTSPPPSVEPV